LDEALGKCIEDLEDGFKNGEEDLFKWIN